MINEKTKMRELAYVVKIDDIKPIPGKDRVECAVVGGWTVMVRKEQFKPGDLGIYFEIDSKVPEKEPFEFLAGKHYKIKTQKYKNSDGSHFYSQGLLMSFEDLSMEEKPEGTFLTEQLGVTYADAEDNKRKASSADKYKLMAQRQGKRFSKQPYRWLMQRDWGKKLLFFFFGRKSDKKRQWPDFVRKTDEERVQNLAHALSEYSRMEWYPTEKVDGTSTTFALRGKNYYVCSRNVVMNLPNKEKGGYYAETDGNVYVEMAVKYDMETVLKRIMDRFEADYVVVQGETYGGTIQKRNYSTKEHDLAVFNVILGLPTGEKRLNPFAGKELMDSFHIPYVPLISEEPISIPDNVEGILAMAGGASAIDGLPREGVVFRSTDGVYSFKAVDNEFLVKYHQ